MMSHLRAAPGLLSQSLDPLQSLLHQDSLQRIMSSLEDVENHPSETPDRSNHTECSSSDVKTIPSIITVFTVLSSNTPSLSMSSAVGRLFWFQTDGPGVSGHNVPPSMDAAGVNPLVELVSDDAEVSVLHDDVARDGRQDLLAVFIPAEEDTEEIEVTGLYLGPGFVRLGHVPDCGRFRFY